jgi:hypothetical protein
MHPRRLALWIGLFVLALTGQAIAADLPLKPARPAQPAAPASASPLTAPSAACLEWTDGCRVCQRSPNGEASCSNVGIACVPKAEECTRR